MEIGYSASETTKLMREGEADGSGQQGDRERCKNFLDPFLHSWMPITYISGSDNCFDDYGDRHSIVERVLHNLEGGHILALISKHILVLHNKPDVRHGY